ncbi:prenyltransferase/squalene oxidase repeat-containing protein [Streptomyces griseosporeus]|uniref:prenyltransferase/squalene oxidase repeat-containing protein n=1 Tax=Streptomyces griseosporeus TaxID=1910 RepID=UPI003696B42A
MHGLCTVRDRLPLPPSLADAVDHTLERAARRLEGTHNRDGGWGQRPGQASDPVSTGYALAALGLLQRRRLVPSALAYLAACQRPDGGSTPPLTPPHPARSPFTSRCSHRPTSCAAWPTGEGENRWVTPPGSSTSTAPWSTPPTSTSAPCTRH